MIEPSTYSSSPIPTTLRRQAVASLVAVVGILALLGVTPLVVDRQVQAHRRIVTEVVDSARVAVNDLEAAQTSEVLAAVLAIDGDSAEAAQLRATASIESARDLATLAHAAAALGPEAVRRLLPLRDGVAHDHLASDASRIAHEQSDALRRSRAFEDWLTTRASVERAEARRVERWGLGLILLLVPLALLGMLILWRASRQVMALADAATRDRAALAETLAAKAALARGVTHDLKNPLGAALGYVRLLEDGTLGNLDPGPRAVMSRVRALIASTVQTVDDLLDVARADSAEIALVLARTDLVALVSEVAEDYAVAARASGVTLAASMPASPLLADTDPRRVRQILGNLFGNALKYTPQGGSVQVAVAADERRHVAHVTIADSGRGIPEQYRERVFEEFFRLPEHDGAGAPAGAGVGLAISRRLARRLGGDLTLARADIGGAAFTLSLPTTRPAGVAPRSRATGPASSVAPYRSRTIGPARSDPP